MTCSGRMRGQDSVAVSIPSLHQCASKTLILEAWRGLTPVGTAVHIPVSTLLLVRHHACCSRGLCMPAQQVWRVR